MGLSSSFQRRYPPSLHGCAYRPDQGRRPQDRDERPDRQPRADRAGGIEIVWSILKMAENNKNIGPKRLVVGAHYGLKDWLAQRVTAIVMGIYTIILLVAFLTA